MTEKLKIKNHASVLIIPSPSGREFFLSGYDQGYPREIYRGKANLIGGNYDKRVDKSPGGILHREVSEELSLPSEEAKEFASKGDILMIRNEILGNVFPYQDFIQSNYAKEGDLAILSVYSSHPPREVFDCIIDNLNSGKRLVTEGITKIATLNQLISGEILTAWGVPEILGHYINESFPNPQGVKEKPIGIPLSSMEEYFSKYDYSAVRDE